MATVEDALKSYRNHPDFLGHEGEIGVNTRGLGEDTPLHIAVRRGNLDHVELFIAADADVNLPGDLGFTALHYAVMWNHPEIVRVLLTAGADRLIKNEWGDTPILLARRTAEELPREKLAANREIQRLLRSR